MNEFNGNYYRTIGNAEDQRAAADPANDFYGIYYQKQPKLEIGQYVRDQGFNVPIIDTQDEWEKAFDEGNAMLRSELPQDYDGLSGLLSSERISIEEMHQGSAFYSELGNLVMRGLRSGELDPTEYMSLYNNAYSNWSVQQAEVLRSALSFNADIYIDSYSASASRWRYVEGTNVSMFADPNVEGRYHFGVRPTGKSVGGYQFEPGEYDTPKQFRKHDSPFVPRPFIEAYDAIKNLARFDSTQNPVLELQQGIDGEIHFLQYLKTNQREEFTEPFDLPMSDETLRTDNVRGITSPSGQDMRMFMAPNLLRKGMEGQAIFCGLIRPRGIEAQFAANVAGFVLHEAYISFQDNHFDASPLYRPPLAAGLSTCQGTEKKFLQKLDRVMDEAMFSKVSPFSREAVPYLDIRVTSNGHEAAIESDWDVKVIGYQDI